MKIDREIQRRRNRRVMVIIAMTSVANLPPLNSWANALERVMGIATAYFFLWLSED